MISNFFDILLTELSSLKKIGDWQYCLKRCLGKLELGGLSEDENLLPNIRVGQILTPALEDQTHLTSFWGSSTHT